MIPKGWGLAGPAPTYPPIDMLVELIDFQDRPQISLLSRVQQGIHLPSRSFSKLDTIVAGPPAVNRFTMTVLFSDHKQRNRNTTYIRKVYQNEERL